VLDAVQGARFWPVAVVGLLDEPAHLLTAWLLLAALLPSSRRTVLPWALAASVAIDLDHVPLYLWGVGTATGSGRPVTHSLLFALMLLAAGMPAGRVRTALSGLAAGVLAHLVRDIATGPGVPLLWPVQDQSVQLPYTIYLTALGAVTVVTVLRRTRWTRSGVRRR
jgi:inner membrane protein